MTEMIPSFPLWLGLPSVWQALGSPRGLQALQWAWQAVHHRVSALAFDRNALVARAEWKGHVPFFVFSAFNAFAQPTLTSSLCSLRHAINLPPPGATPEHILSASALQRARGAAALAVWVDAGSEITASESNEAAVN